MEGSGRVLVVDLGGTGLAPLAGTLVSSGFDVQRVTSIERAAEVLAPGGRPPHAVVSDARAAGLFARISSNSNSIQRILVCGAHDIQRIASIINESGIFRLLPFPVADEQLLEAARSAVEEWRLQTAARRLQDERHTQILRAKREWEVAFDSISEPLMIIDREKRILRANLALARHFGRDIKEIPGSICHELRATSPNRFPRDPDGTCSGCPAADGSGEAELRTMADRTYSVAAFPVVETRDGHDRDAVVCRYTDLTERRAMARQLAVADKLSALGLLAGGVAHEVNNPLGAILAFAQLVRRERLPEEEQQEYIREIEESAIRCKKIVERLLSFARQGRRDERRLFSLNDVVSETAFLVDRSYLPAQIRLHRELDPQLGLVNGNQNEIQQVLLNLISNARDAMPGGGVVRVRTRDRGDGTVELAVTDTGAGIPQEIIEHIFDPFFTTKPEGKGTGLGLAVSYGIIREHRGRIAVKSKVGEGTEFQVLLPVVA
jgi:two-component system NtrC family sensor kinase